MKLPTLSLAPAVLLLVLLSAAMQPSTANALYCTSLPTQSSVEAADVVLIGTFLSIEEPDEEGIDATVEVERYLKGKGSAVITMRSTARTKREDGTGSFIPGAWFPQWDRPVATPSSEVLPAVEVIDSVQSVESDVGKRYLLVLSEGGDALIADWCNAALSLDHPKADTRLAETEAITGPGVPPDQAGVQQQSIAGNESWAWGIGVAALLVGGSGLAYLRSRR